MYQVTPMYQAAPMYQVAPTDGIRVWWESVETWAKIVSYNSCGFLRSWADTLRACLLPFKQERQIPRRYRLEDPKTAGDRETTKLTGRIYLRQKLFSSCIRRKIGWSRILSVRRWLTRSEEVSSNTSRYRRCSEHQLGDLCFGFEPVSRGHFLKMRRKFTLFLATNATPVVVVCQRWRKK